MGIKLAKDSIDLGIIVTDGPKALAFYRDTLGFEHIATTPMPGGGGTMERLMCPCAAGRGRSRLRFESFRLLPCHGW